jgi:hypothetical protein
MNKMYLMKDRIWDFLNEYNQREVVYHLENSVNQVEYYRQLDWLANNHPKSLYNTEK